MVTKRTVATQMGSLLAVLTLAGGLLPQSSLAQKSPGGSLADRENQYYRMVDIPVPPNVQFESGGLLFVGPDTLACSTRIGDVWIGQGVTGDAPHPKWTLFASGLHEVLSMAYRDGWLYAVQRGEVTRLKDTNGDGRADILETYCDDWGINGDYHEYDFGSKFDRDGNMWVVLTLTGSFSSEDPFRGWCMRITPDGKAIPTVSGIRSPGGIGFNAAGDVFYTDNQGPWNGACKLTWLKPNTFAGHPGGFSWFNDPATRDRVAAAGLKKPVEPKSGSRMYDEAKKIPELMLPAVYFPYQKMGQSASGVACDTSNGKFGPFKEQMFVGEQTHSTVMRVCLEMVDGKYQGACLPFREGFGSGNLGEEFAPDGSLFSFGTDRGWGARGGKPFSLQSIHWTGKTPFEIHDLKATPEGFDFNFTQPVSEDSASKLEAYQVNTFIYIYQASYGSPEVDATTARVKQVKISADKKTVSLVIDGLVEGHIHEFHLPGVQSATGEPLLHDSAYYTLNKIPGKTSN